MESKLTELDRSIFRAYDIRGRVGVNLTDDVVYRIGRAFANVVQSRTQRNKIVIGGDGRLSTANFRTVLASGLTDGGLEVVDIGLAPTPLVYFASLSMQIEAGIVVTGSHNPGTDNGLKFFFGRDPYAGEELQDLFRRVETSDFGTGSGQVERISSVSDYVKRVKESVSLKRRFKVIVDSGNGVAGSLARQVFEALGCEVEGIFEDVDGTFPNHHPDPSRPENLRELVANVVAQGADVGFALDGDGDRIGIVANKGEMIAADRLVALFAGSILEQNLGSPIIFDVKCGYAVPCTIEKHGGEAVMCATGHSNLKYLLKKKNAPFAGEFSGHICFADRWFGFDDAIYAGVRFLELLDGLDRTASELFSDIPNFPSTPELFVVTDDRAKFAIIERLKVSDGFGDGRKILLDGLRVEYDDGWGLVRVSNTSPKLTLRFEAVNDSTLERIQRLFRNELRKIDPELKISWT